MANNLVIDIIDGTRGRLTVEGWELERVATVYGLTGTASAKILNATIVTGMPSLGDAHPGYSGAFLQEILPEALDDDTVKLRLIYRVPQLQRWQPSLDTVEVGGTLSQVDTNKYISAQDGDDITRSLISVQYAYPSDYEYSQALQSKTVDQSGLVSKLIPEHSLIITKLEYTNPSPIAKNYIGTVNSGPWTLDLTADARQWLCTGIIGRSDDGGTIYKTTYSFQYREDTWDVTVTFIDPYTGRPPPDVVDDTGVKTLKEYKEMNFNNLPL